MQYFLCEVFVSAALAAYFLHKIQLEASDKSNANRNATNLDTTHWRFWHLAYPRDPRETFALATNRDYFSTVFTSDHPYPVKFVKSQYKGGLRRKQHQNQKMAKRNNCIFYALETTLKYLFWCWSGAKTAWQQGLRDQKRNFGPILQNRTVTSIVKDFIIIQFMTECKRFSLH